MHAHPWPAAAQANNRSSVDNLPAYQLALEAGTEDLLAIGFLARLLNVEPGSNRWTERTMDEAIGIFALLAANGHAVIGELGSDAEGRTTVRPISGLDGSCEALRAWVKSQPSPQDRATCLWAELTAVGRAFVGRRSNDH